MYKLPVGYLRGRCIRPMALVLVASIPVRPLRRKAWVNAVPSSSIAGGVLVCSCRSMGASGGARRLASEAFHSSIGMGRWMALRVSG